MVIPQGKRAAKRRSAGAKRHPGRRPVAKRASPQPASRPAPPLAPRDLTKETVAGALRIHPRTITRYSAEGMPHTRGGHGQPHLYNMGEVLEWLMAQGRPPFAQLGADSDGKAAADLKLKREKGRREELKRLQEEEKLHDTAECRQRHLQQLWALKREFLALPRSVAPELEGRDRGDIERALSARMVGLLERFAQGYVEEGH